MDTTKLAYNKILSYGSSIKNSNLVLHIIFYSKGKMFEYNPYTEEIRPFNTIFWYRVNSDDFYYILNYFMEKYNEMLELSHDERTEKSYDLGYGTVCDNTFAVEMDKFREYMSLQKFKTNIMKEFDEFIEYIENVYTKWDEVHSFLLNSNKFDGILNK